MSSHNNQTGADLMIPDVEDTPAPGEVVPSGPDRTLARRSERGMVSAEWTVGIIAAIAIAGVLLAVVTSAAVKASLLHVVLAIIKTFTKGL